jgi:hypothetical protein
MGTQRTTTPISDFEYDRRALRFRYKATGQFVPKDLVQEVVNDRIEDSMRKMGDYANAVMSGRTSATISDWQEAMAVELRNLHLQMGMLGKGGRSQMTASDWGRIGNTLKGEYKYLARFAQEIAAGNLTEGQIRARMNMYANKAYNGYWQGRSRGAQDNGYSEERRVLNPAEHCDDCIGLSRLGWQPLGSLPEPADGSTACLSNCKCSKEYR